MVTMAFDPILAERIREALAPTPVREVKMFGGISFLVDDKMVVSVRGQGGLLVRCDPGSVDQLVDRDGASRAEMRGKPMKEGWIHVKPEVLDDEALAFWLDTALTYNTHLD